MFFLISLNLLIILVPFLICSDGEEGDSDLHDTAVHLDDSHVSIEFKCLQGPDDRGIEGQTTITIIGPESGHHLAQDINGKMLSQ